MHHIAFHKEFIRKIGCIFGKLVNILPQIQALVFIHDRKQEEEFLVDTFLLNKHTQIQHSGDSSEAKTL